MAVYLQRDLVSFLIISALIFEVQAVLPPADYKWEYGVAELLTSRNEMLNLAQTLESEKNLANTKEFITNLGRRILTNLKKFREGSDSFTYSTHIGHPIMAEEKVLQQVRQLLGKTMTVNPFYEENSMGRVIHLYNSHNYMFFHEGTTYDERVKVLLDFNKKFLQYCSFDHTSGGVEDQFGTFSKTLLTTKLICINVNECGVFTNNGACTSTKKCDIDRAIPKMIGLLWLKTGYWMARRLCSDSTISSNLTYLQNYDANAMYDDVVREIEEVMAYASVFEPYFKETWKDIPNQALKMKAFSQIHKAIALIKENELNFRIAYVACDLIRDQTSCPFGDIYKQYSILESTRKYRMTRPSVRDLRPASHIELSDSINQKLVFLKYFKLLDNIVSLDNDLKVSISGISTYFNKIASYDETIAFADVDFIKTKLDDFEKKSFSVNKDLKDKFEDGLILMETKLAVKLGAKVIALAIVVAENSNPLKWIFGGPDVSEILEKTNEVAQAAADVAKGGLVIREMINVNQDTKEIGAAFFTSEGGNKNQIKVLHAILKKINESEGIVDIDVEAAQFVEQYKAYNPQVDRPRLAESDAKWTTYKNTMCEFLNEDGGLAETVVTVIETATMLCETLDGILARFFSLRTEIFDFQFELIDAMNRVVRSNIAKRFSSNIQSGDLIDATQVMAGFLMIHARLQSDASLYCDLLEYKSLGNTALDECSTVEGFFSEGNLEALFVHRNDPPCDLRRRTAYIPIRPSANDEKRLGFIDIEGLMKGETVSFTLPYNMEWLANHGWLRPSTEELDVPFVKSLRIYLPKKDYDTEEGKLLTTTTVTTTATSSPVYWNLPNTGTKYILSKADNEFVTEYEEGYSSGSCRKEIHNPYSLCRNLPKICDISRRVAGEDNPLPTLFSKWTIRLNINRGYEAVTWNAANSTTNLLIRAQVCLRFLKTKPVIPRKLLKSDAALVIGDKCCNGNTYRVSLYNHKCEACPTNSRSRHRGLYCERRGNK